MRKYVWALSLAMVAPLVVVADSEDLKAIDPVMGNWEGDWNDSNSGSQGEVTAKIVARGKGMYKGLFLADVNGQTFPLEFPLKGASESSTEYTGKINLGEDQGGESDFKFQIKDGVLKGTVKNESVDVTLEMCRVYKKGDTIGAKPPEGAVVLFDGSSTGKFTHGNGKPVAWEIVNGAIEDQGWFGKHHFQREVWESTVAYRVPDPLHASHARTRTRKQRRLCRWELRAPGPR